jgi:hypothetical protein
LWGRGEKFSKPLYQNIGKEKLKLQIVILQKDNLAKFGYKKMKVKKKPFILASFNHILFATHDFLCGEYVSKELNLDVRNIFGKVSHTTTHTEHRWRC